MHFTFVNQDQCGSVLHLEKAFFTLQMDGIDSEWQKIPEPVKAES